MEIGRVFGGSQNSLQWLIAGLHDFLEGVVLPHHTPLLTRVVPGEIAVRKNGEPVFLAVGEGASVNAALARSLAQLKVKRRRRV